MLRRRLHEPAERGARAGGGRGAVEKDLGVEGLRLGMTFFGGDAEEYDPILPCKERQVGSSPGRSSIMRGMIDLPLGTIRRMVEGGLREPIARGDPPPRASLVPLPAKRGRMRFSLPQNFTPTVPNTVRPAAIVA